MSYRKSEQGQTTVFDVEPEPMPVPMRLQPGLYVVTLLLVYGMGYLIRLMILGDNVVGRPAHPNFVWWPLLLAIAICFGISRMKQHSRWAQKYRVPSKFSISTEGISIGGKLIPREDIHRVIIRNHALSGSDSSGLMYEAGTGVAAAAVSAARYQQRIGAISYRVDVEAGGVSHTLAGGLNEPVAFAVRTDVSTLLGLK
jgi:hypothetical protein